MALPNEPVTLSVEQIAELNRKLSTMRHDINGKLTQISLAVELLRLKPEGGDRWLVHDGRAAAKNRRRDHALFRATSRPRSASRGPDPAAQPRF